METIEESSSISDHCEVDDTSLVMEPVLTGADELILIKVVV